MTWRLWNEPTRIGFNITAADTGTVTAVAKTKELGARIVAAVNAHDDLVAFYRAYCDMARECEAQVDDKFRTMMDRIDRAISAPPVTA